MKREILFSRWSANGLPASRLALHGLASKKPPFRQRGVVLVMTLVALVAMTMAALAMVRSVDTSNLVAGNVTAKQAAMQEAQGVLDVAFRCLDAGGALATGPFAANSATCNYYATLQPDIAKPYSIPDVLEAAPGTLNTTTGFTSAYVIERMCDPGTTGWEQAKCTESPYGKAATHTNRIRRGVPSYQALYRVSVKVSGPRNVAAYAQMIVSGSI